MKISVIIPIFNAEIYLNKCIDSILSQSYDDFEIILINDGSTDKSYSICQKYSSEDDRVKLINKKNSGVCDTRNYGIRHATGEWITFIDADDWIGSDCFTKFINAVNRKEVDLVVVGNVIHNKNGYFPGDTYSDTTSDIEYFLKKEFKQLSCWGYFFKNEILKKNKIQFNNRVAFSEDILFCVNYFIYAKRVTCISENYYHYNTNDQSVTKKKKTKKMVFDQLTALKNIVNITPSKIGYIDLTEQLINRLVKLHLTSLSTLPLSIAIILESRDIIRKILMSQNNKQKLPLGLKKYSMFFCIILYRFKKEDKNNN